MDERGQNSYPELGGEKRIVSLLGHFLNNKIGAILGFHDLSKIDPGTKLIREQLKATLDEFIAGLQHIIEKIKSGEYKETETWNQQKLESMIEQARQLDPMDEQAVRKFYQENAPKQY